MNHVKSGTVLYVPAPTFQHQVKHGVRTQRSLGQIDLKKNNKTQRELSVGSLTEWNLG